MLERIHPPNTSRNDRTSSSETESFRWFHLSAPTVDEILSCHERFGIPINYMSQVLDPHEVPRTAGLDQTKLRDPVLISLLYPARAERPQAVEPELGRGPFRRKQKQIYLQESGTYTCRLLQIVRTGDLLLTVSERPLNLDDLFTERRRPDHYPEGKHNEDDLSRLEPLLTYDTPEAIIQLLIWEINRRFIRDTRVLEERRRRIESLMAHSGKTELLMAISQLQESLVRFQTATAVNRDVLGAIKNAKFMPQELQQVTWLDDLLIEAKQAEIMVSGEASMLEQLNESFSAIISNNLNVTMKMLTSLTFIITIPTIIGGLWGMNVALPISGNPQAFWILLALSGVLCLVLAYILKRKDLL